MTLSKRAVPSYRVSGAGAPNTTEADGAPYQTASSNLGAGDQTHRGVLILLVAIKASRSA